MTKGRDSKLFLSYFKGLATFICGVYVESEASSHSAEFITNCAQALDFSAKKCDSISDAVSHITTLSDVPARILICGSLYLSGDVLLYNKS